LPFPPACSILGAHLRNSRERTPADMFKLFWDAHKWTGIVLGLVVLNLAATGFLLLIKKDHAWIQPPTRKGAEGGVAEFIANQRLFEVVFAQGNPDFASLDDIERVDFRPGKRVFKVHSEHHYAEMQVDAVTGTVLSVAKRNSDLIESIHDGSFYGVAVHDWLMPVTACALAFLVASGLYVWLQPKLKRARRRRAVPPREES
jgi:uncharacterized iron-regulated membrane protein